MNVRVIISLNLTLHAVLVPKLLAVGIVSDHRSHTCNVTTSLHCQATTKNWQYIDYSSSL